MKDFRTRCVFFRINASSCFKGCGNTPGFIFIDKAIDKTCNVKIISRVRILFCVKPHSDYTQAVIVMADHEIPDWYFDFIIASWPATFG